MHGSVNHTLPFGMSEWNVPHFSFFDINFLSKAETFSGFFLWEEIFLEGLRFSFILLGSLFFLDKMKKLNARFMINTRLCPHKRNWEYCDKWLLYWGWPIQNISAFSQNNKLPFLLFGFNSIQEVRKFYSNKLEKMAQRHSKMLATPQMPEKWWRSIK